MKYKGLSVIVSNEEQFNKMKEILGDDLYINWVVQMERTRTAVVIEYKYPDIFSRGSVGKASYQQELGCELINFRDYLKIIPDNKAR